MSCRACHGVEHIRMESGLNIIFYIRNGAMDIGNYGGIPCIGKEARERISDPRAGRLHLNFALEIIIPPERVSTPPFGETSSSWRLCLKKAADPVEVETWGR